VKRGDRALECVAYHEAAHAVARIYCGFGATDTEINSDGSGTSHGTGGCALDPTYLVVLLAGPCAEARVAGQSRMAVLFSGGGKDDWAALRQHPLYSAKALIAQKETNRFLRRAWLDIDRVARALIDLGKLPASKTARLVGQKRLYSSNADFARRWEIATTLESKSHV
jgi:hypothetical protein